MAPRGCACFGSVAAGHVWEMDFPRVVFSGRHVFSQRWTAGKHMASFRRAVATCVTDRPWKYKNCKWNSAENTQCAVSPFTFYLPVLVQAAVRIPQGPAGTCTDTRRKLLMHTCPLNHTPCFCSSLNIWLISRCPSFPPLGE